MDPHVISQVQAPEVYEPRKLLRLDFGCGQNPREGFEGIDLYAPDAKHRVDLWKFPLPWPDESCEDLHASHFLEHLPAREVEERDVIPEVREIEPLLEQLVGQDYFFAFMDECHRILIPGGTMTIIVPCARSNRGFQDPTHRRFFVEETFYYLNRRWREEQKLDHYRVRSDFDSSGSHIVRQELTLRHQEVQAEKFRSEWNAVMDLQIVLKKK